MHIKTAAVYFFATITLLYSCNKRQVPQHTAAVSPAATSAPAAKKTVPKKVNTAVPKVIAVNDNVAKRNIDGRLYYDLNGHRYWRNYNDGKYYLYNKSMYSDSAFIPH